MRYSVKPLPFKPPRLVDIPGKTLATHYQTSYGQLVQSLNASDLHNSETDALLANIALHEIFYDSLGGEDGVGTPAVEMSGDIKELAEQSFGGANDFNKQLKQSLIEAINQVVLGTRWLVVAFSPSINQIFIRTVKDNGELPMGLQAVLAFDAKLFTDYGSAELPAEQQAALLMNNIHWQRANLHIQGYKNLYKTPPPLMEPLPVVSPEEVLQWQQQGKDALVLDVCLTDDIPDRTDQVPGSITVISEEIDKLELTCSKTTPIAAYCMFGFQVSQNAVIELRKRGFDARLMAGGIAGFRATGAETQPYAGKTSS